MKKPLFVIAEIFLSAVFVAAAAATAAVAVDIKTDMLKSRLRKQPSSNTSS